MREAVRGAGRPRHTSAPDGTSPLSQVDGRDIDLGSLGESIGYALRRAQVRVFEDFIKALSKLDLKPAQFSVLVVVDRNSGLKQSQVSAVLGIQRTNFVAMVDELERRGLVLRQAVPGDRRSYALVLTDHGRQHLRKALVLQGKHEARIAAQLGDGGQETLLRLLNSLALA